MTARSARYARQVRLREIGVAGQERLLRATVSLGVTDDAAALAERYLLRAGVAVVGTDGVVRAPADADGEAASAATDSAAAPRQTLDLSDADFAHGAAFTTGAEAVARGAWLALAAMRRVLASELAGPAASAPKGEP